jgi:hypothetical protein
MYEDSMPWGQGRKEKCKKKFSIIFHRKNSWGNSCTSLLLVCLTTSQILSLMQGGGIQIRCYAAPCSAARGPFDHFEIRANSNLKILTRISKWSNGPRAALHGTAQQRIHFQGGATCSWEWTFVHPALFFFFKNRFLVVYFSMCLDDERINVRIVFFELVIENSIRLVIFSKMWEYI